MTKNTGQIALCIVFFLMSSSTVTAKDIGPLTLDRGLNLYFYALCGFAVQLFFSPTQIFQNFFREFPTRQGVHFARLFVVTNATMVGYMLYMLKDRMRLKIIGEICVAIETSGFLFSVYSYYHKDLPQPHGIFISGALAATLYYLVYV
jgi:hypothetical protein